jgi:uncharacterized protein YerC
MEYTLKCIPSGWDDYGYKKTTHVITIDDIKNLTDLKSALRQVDQVIWEELYEEREYSQYDCTGSYSTSKIQKVHRSFSYGTLLVILNEYGSYDI